MDSVLSFSVLALLLAKSTFVVCLAYAGTSLLRKHSGAARHVVWAAAMAVLVLILAAAPLMPWRVGMPALSTGISAVLPATPAAAASSSAEAPQTKAAPAQSRIVRITTPSRLQRAERAILTLSWTRTLMWIWWLGIALVALRQFIARVQLSRLSRRARVTEGEETRRCEQMVRERGIGRPVTLLVSDEVDVPLTWGMFNARILLPSGYGEWETRRFDNVLHHELAHVRRLDVFTALLADVACALYWFNPLVWRAATQMRIEREIACDEAVLATGAKASDYATDLVDLAVNVRFGSLNRAGLAIAGCPRFEQRVRSIVNSAPRIAMSRLAFAATVIIALAVLPLAAVQTSERPEVKTWPVPSAYVQAFHKIVRSGDFNTMVKQASADPTLINSREQYGNTPLLISLTTSPRGAWYEAETRWLIEHGADVNAQGAMNMAPLMTRSALLHPDIVKLLLYHGADPNLRDLYERTALDYVAMFGGDDEKADDDAELLLARGAQMKFIDAVLLGRAEDVRAFLNKDPGLIDSVPSFPPGGFMHETPLEYAAQCMWASPSRCGPMVDLLGDYIREPNLFQATILGRIDRMRELLDGDASRINQTDKWQRTALDWAVLTQRTEVARFLLERGAEPRFDQLSMAVHGGSKPMVELLLTYSVPRRSGRTGGSANSSLLLRDWAANNGHPDIAALLTEK